MSATYSTITHFIDIAKVLNLYIKTFSFPSKTFYTKVSVCLTERLKNLRALQTVGLGFIV